MHIRQVLKIESGQLRLKAYYVVVIWFKTKNNYFSDFLPYFFYRDILFFSFEILNYDLDVRYFMFCFNSKFCLVEMNSGYVKRKMY